jgi:signal peptidase I
MKKIIPFLIIFIVSVFFIFNPQNIKNDNYVEPISVPDCLTEERVVIVRGDSMTPYLVPDDEVKALFGYYDCHDVLRNDVVLYKYSGKENLLIKFVRAVPGDKWDLRQSGVNYNIIVNDTVLLNSAGSPYLIADTSIKMLQLYVKDYPVIPENTYLLLGDKVEGSLDSSAFGLVGKDDIMARVEI